MLTIQDLVDAEKGPIWVVNRSSQKYDHTAELFITMVQNDQRAVCIVPSTWLPICLTERFPRAVVLGSQYFTEAVSNGLLGIISAKEAQVILMRQGADDEKERLKAQEEAVRAASQSRGIASNVTVINPNDTDTEVVAQERPAPRVRTVTPISSKGTVSMANSMGDEEDEEDDTDSSGDVSPSFQAWVLKLNTMPASQISEIINLVKGRGSYSSEEAKFLAEHSKHERVRKMAKKAVAQLS